MKLNREIWMRVLLLFVLVSPVVTTKLFLAGCTGGKGLGLDVLEDKDDGESGGGEDTTPEWLSSVGDDADIILCVGDDASSNIGDASCTSEPETLGDALDLMKSDYPADNVAIVLGTGTQSGSFTLDSDHSNLRIVGVSMGDSVIQNSGTTYADHTLDFTDSVSGVTIEYVTLGGNGSSTSSSTDSDANYAGNVALTDAGNVTFNYVAFEDNWRKAIYIEAADTVTINDTTIADIERDTDSSYAIWNESSNLYLHNVDITATDYDVAIWGNSTTGVIGIEQSILNGASVIGVHSYGAATHITSGENTDSSGIDLYVVDASEVGLSSPNGGKFVTCRTDEDETSSIVTMMGGGGTIEFFYLLSVTLMEESEGTAINNLFVTDVEFSDTSYASESYETNDYGCDWIEYL